MDVALGFCVESSAAILSQLAHDVMASQSSSRTSLMDDVKENPNGAALGAPSLEKNFLGKEVNGSATTLAHCIRPVVQENKRYGQITSSKE